ncbi:cell wall metabolism sensor histidine kinase WalK [uncultured Ruminococcus sp.]|uniref:sensor histidine kinase n=1 Tax=uncultured Ruminococcus sp. TaxID=165186 RepID=UPI0025D138A3|nr:HAMP domain-containing sensor histidine kinase [uncultured Ruminococcus sp.]
MFKRVHLRLTLLFSAVTITILLVMSVLFAYFSYRSMQDTAMLTFVNDMDSFSADLSKSDTISFDKILEQKKNHGYILSIYDNDYPLRITEESMTDGEKAVVRQAMALSEDVYIKHNSLYTEHVEFSGRIDGELYRISHMLVPKGDSFIEVYAVQSQRETKQQFMHLCLLLGVVIVMAAAALSVFAWLFTKRLLLPIKVSQQRQTEFIAAASHEIRNPVNNIMTAVSSIEGADEAHKEELISIAVKESKRLARLTGDLLTLARSDSKSFKASFGKAELDTIVLECFEAAMPKAAEKGIRTDIVLPDDTVSAENIDGDRIKQVVSILLDNAVSYTPAGGKIVLSLEDSQKHYIIKVADSGCGIPDEMKEKVFERFYRADDSRTEKEHFGLGLCIAKELTELHGGSISASDNEGGGAVFTVKLPK